MPTLPQLKSFEGLRFEHLDNGVFHIRFDRPSRYNALTTEMMRGLIAGYNYASAHPDVVVTVLSGSGRYFTSGNDLANFMQFIGASEEELAIHVKSAGEMAEQWAKAMIDHAKPLIALVNGPAVGGGLTMLGLFDFVYASDTLVGTVPLTKIGQCPELCSSYTFPLIMGPIRANEILLACRPINAKEALDLGIVTKVFPHATFEESAWNEIAQLLKLPPKTLAINKRLMRDVHREGMYRASEREAATIQKMWTSDECMEAIANFFQSRTPSKI